ncbi:glycosyltransferase family 39 protein [Caldicellulosiruptor changbaiensis]|uniref:Glycosyltransferase family 39 protein n=1 Tax=Caldicellulosiruptor changbaiensis TaxID=1222016 RepID=A0A3T0D8P6_9FIRM|nr:glycosyltransferase family 39 protein [Caldicellulosiruptor changbaiensis]AZT91414.1 glycosyltransferase family 39 protein [Caldicellulosiruptor changbaiensis]
MKNILALKSKIVSWSKENSIVFLPMTIGTFLYTFLIAKVGYGNEYYAAAVKSMMQNFKNFFFASFDPGGFVTVDKPPLGFWIQTLSCLLFGYSGISLLLPQIIAAVLSILLVYIIVKNHFGKMSAFFASLFLSTTPIYTAIARNNTIDMLMILSCILAIYFALKAIEKSSFKHFLISVFIIGLGFNIKMLQAWIVAPGIFLAYLLFTDKRLLKRFSHLVLAGVIFLVSSLWWCIVVDLTPAEKRPYMGSSQTNSALELALSYNGIQRFLPSGGSFSTIINSIFGKNSSQSTGFSSTFGPRFSFAQNINPMGAREGGEPGILRLFNQNMAGQISWVLVLAIIAFLALIIMSLAVRKKNKMLGAFTTIWGTWFLLLFVYFSFTRGLFHIYYLATIAPSVSVFAGVGLGALFDKLNESKTWIKLLALIPFVLTAAYQVYNVYRYQDSNKYWYLFAIGFAVTALIALAMIFLKNLKVLKFIAISLMAISLSIMPFYWSLTCSLYQGNAVIPSAGNPINRTSAFVMGPGLRQNFGTFDERTFDQRNNYLPRDFGFNPPSNSNSDMQPPVLPDSNSFAYNNRQRRDLNNFSPRGFGESSLASDELTQYLLKNNTGEKFILAVIRATEAAPIIIKTGKAVMAMGGFSGNDPILTVEKLKKMIKNGEVKFFQIGGIGRFRGGLGFNEASNDIYSWILENGELVNSTYNIYMVDKSKIK